MANGGDATEELVPMDAMAVIRRCLVAGLVWLAEGMIGLFPLLGYLIVGQYGRHEWRQIACPPETSKVAGLTMLCFSVPEGIGREVCILAVVFSGITLLNMIPFSHHRAARFTVFTFVLLMFTFLSMFVASLLYALIAVDADRDTDVIVIWSLLFALASSAALSFEKAVYGR